MNKKLLSAAGLAFAILTSNPLLADTFNFSFTGNSSVTGSPGVPFSGAGQFTADATGTTGVFLITGVSGTTAGQTISTVLTPGSFGFNDNLLFFTTGAASATLDNSGVSYQLANGVDANLFLGVPSQFQQTLFGFSGGLISEAQTAPISITPVGAISAVPEPETLTFLGTGMLAIAGTIRRRICV